MKIEQFVMAYGVEQDRLRASLPNGFMSLRPVLRINAEIKDGRTGYLEFNTAVEKDGKKGWLNIAYWEDMPFNQEKGTTVFKSDFLTIFFKRVGVVGGCPSEKDNVGCYFLKKDGENLRNAENITVGKEFCDCSFEWHFGDDYAKGSSIGKTLPAIPEEVKNVYPKQDLTAENAAAIPCRQVLGSYVVNFDRE